MEPRRMEPRGEREERGSSFVAPTKKGKGEFHPADRPADTCACECEECHPPAHPTKQTSSRISPILLLHPTYSSRPFSVGVTFSLSVSLKKEEASLALAVEKNVVLYSFSGENGRLVFHFWKTGQFAFTTALGFLRFECA